jgi:hypothetical protein
VGELFQRWNVLEARRLRPSPKIYQTHDALVGEAIPKSPLRVIDLCAWVHAEWVRIHPFANGNGLTARLWANSLAVRYGLPPFIRFAPKAQRRLRRCWHEVDAGRLETDFDCLSPLAKRLSS